VLAAVHLALALIAPQADGHGPALERLEEALRPHPYLGRVAYTRVDAFAPFYFFVKRPDADESGYYERVAGEYGPWFRELERMFVAAYARPLGLARRPDHVLYPVFVLDSGGAYKDYADAVRTTGLYAARAHYDPQLGLAVTFENAYQPESRSEHRRAALHELVHALQHAYFGEAERMPEVAWFNEGLADYLSYCEGLLPPALLERAPDAEALQLVAILSSSPEVLAAGLFPLEELAALRDYGEVEAAVRARGGGVEFRVAGEAIAIPLFYAQASLRTYFLHHGEGGRHRAAYLRYAAAVWRGESGSAPLRAAFEGVDLAELDRAFHAWLRATIAERLRVAVVLPAEPTRTGRSSNGESSPARPPRLEPSELRPDLADPRLGLAVALEEARRGRLGPAEERLAALAAAASEPQRAQFERERARLAAFREARRRFFEHLARPGARKLDTELDGQKILAQVVAVEERRVRFAANKRGLESVLLDQLPNLLVAELARDKKYGFDAGVELAWAYALESDERGKKLVPATDALWTEAEPAYRAQRSLGRAALELAELAEAGAPADAAAAETVLRRLGQLLGEARESELVAGKLGPLRALASAALLFRFEAGGLASVLSGELEELGGGRVRLRYPFDSPDELADFTQTDYLHSQALERARQDFSVRDGRLVGAGFACLRSRLAFEGEQRVRCRARYGEPPEAYDPRYVFLLGLNDDGLVSHAAMDFTGGMRVLDLATNLVQQSQGDGRMLVGETYLLEVVFDGTQVTAHVNQQRRNSLAAGARRSGSPFLLTSADFPLELEELVIEGTLTAEARARFREEWTAARLTELGL
jgi:hypothetical protein